MDQLAANNRRRKDIYTLPRADQELIASLGYKDKLAEADKAILANAEFLKQIVANPEIFGHDVDYEDECVQGDTTRQGKVERDLCYEPMKEALLKHFVHVTAEER
ncbi:hypothetical protein PHLCEN_2v1716 [Hermanssonia centrifuga]|uniref:Uncharacterized protein n=1 Tax=Hermanssonia centrifuga TaxID=98765 RepID=A0A2R6RW05_9APHY|nr:hypothetical protein PHLCEN_2v1716 [Hermanssonia centrifuga]